MNLEFATRGDVSILRFSGKMTIDVGDVKLRVTFDELLRQGNRWFVFDLRSLSTMDSAGLGEIIACQKMVREQGGRIRIVLNRPSRICEFFSLAHLNCVFELFPEEASAIQGFGVESTAR